MVNLKPLIPSLPYYLQNFKLFQYYDSVAL